MNSLIEFIYKKKIFIVYALVKGLILILGLITNILIIRKLSVNDFGIFSLALMLVGLINSIGFSWSTSSILFFGGKEKTQYGSINKTFWARNIILFCSLIMVTILVVLLRYKINKYVGIEVSFLILLWLYITVAEDYLSIYFLAVKKQLLSSMLSLTAKLIYLVLILLITFDIRTLIILNIISHATVLLYILGLNKKDIGKFEFDKSWFNDVLNFSIWQLFGFSGLYLINFGDIAVINHFMTTEDVGLYNAAYKLFNSIAGFSYIILTYFASSVSANFQTKNYDYIKKFFFKERYIIFAISLIGHALVILFAKPIIITLYGDCYIDSIKVFYILMVGSVFSYLSVFYTLYFNTNKKHKLQQSINIFRAFLNVGLDIIFINLFGLIGPAIATSVAIITTTVYSIFYCEKRIKSFCLNETNQNYNL